STYGARQAALYALAHARACGRRVVALPPAQAGARGARGAGQARARAPDRGRARGPASARTRGREALPHTAHRSVSRHGAGVAADLVGLPRAAGDNSNVRAGGRSSGRRRGLRHAGVKPHGSSPIVSTERHHGARATAFGTQTTLGASAAIICLAFL